MVYNHNMLFRLTVRMGRHWPWFRFCTQTPGVRARLVLTAKRSDDCGGADLTDLIT